MKRITHTIFILTILLSVVVIVFFTILKLTTTSEQTKPVKFIDAKPHGEPAPSSNSSNSVSSIISTIALEPNEILLDIYMFNIDFDDEDEQIIAVRESNKPDGFIRIIVADYLSQSKKWVRVWESSSLVTNIKTFQISVIDLIGDHNQNIVCTGIDKDGNQAMTVFWKSSSAASNTGLKFIKIFEQVGSVIFINNSERPDSYKLGQANADSWSIELRREDLASGNYMDQIKDIWEWSFADKSYVLTSSTKIPGAIIAKGKINTILDGGRENFIRFLNGTWYKESTDPLSKNALFITFQSIDNLIMFSGYQTIGVYSWENSSSTRYGLYITSHNQSVQNLRRLMDVELTSLDSIQVRVFQDYKLKADVAGTWDGQYKKLSPEISKAFIHTPAMAAVINNSMLSGDYESADGSKLSFDGSKYTASTNVSRETGVFSIYKLDGKTILDMRPEIIANKVDERRSWILTMDASNSVIKLKRILVGLEGIVDLPDQEVVYKKQLSQD